MRLALLLLALAACGPRYTLTAPPGFVPWEDAEHIELVSADSVHLGVRTVENYPRADLGFWQEAMRRHLLARGYVLTSEQPFATTAGEPGALLEWVAPVTGGDHGYLVALVVRGDEVVLVEATGAYDRYHEHAADLLQAVRTLAQR